MIQSAISNLRKALGHPPKRVEPHLLRLEISCLNPGDWFHVGGNPLFDPMMLFVHGRKSQVNHFVGEHPVRGKLRRRSFIADQYRDSSASIAKRHTVVDASPFARSNANHDWRDGKTAVIGCD